MLFFTLVLACREAVDADSVTIEGGNAEAPTNLNDLTAFMFSEWDNEDSSVIAAGLENIEAMGAEFPVAENPFADRGFEGIRALTEEDVADVEYNHGHDPNDAGGVGLFLQSGFSVDDHVGLFTMTDQKPIEPGSPDKYDRTIVDGGDCFPSQGCDTMMAENDVGRKNLVVDTEHQTTKVWRWVEMSDGRMAVAGRTWQPELADSDKDDKIYQNYSIEVWIPNDDGTLRFLTTWSENSFEFADILIVGSVNDAFEACEEYLGE